MNVLLARLVGCSLSVGLLACDSAPGQHATEAGAPQDTGGFDAGPRDAAADGSSTMDAGADASAQAADGGQPDADGPLPSDGLESFVYVGGWANESYPFKTYGLDRSTGELTELNTSATFGAQPSFITPNQDGSLLYMTNESASGGITLAIVDSTTALPSLLDKRLDSGGGFVHVSLSPNGQVLLAADYNGGRLVSFPIGGDGEVGMAVSTVAFGSGANTHSSAFHPNGRWAYAPNKGLDKIAQFEVDSGSGALTRRADLDTEGHGPRMFTITPDGRYAYVMFEDDGSVEGYRIGNTGLLERLDREATVPNEGWGAHALVHPSGKYLYVSGRDTSSLVSFKVADDGDLMQLERVASEGKAPRCFDIDDSGKWLVVANQGDNDQASVGSLVVFAIAPDGKLRKRGSAVGNLKAPTAVAIVNRPKP